MAQQQLQHQPRQQPQQRIRTSVRQAVDLLESHDETDVHKGFDVLDHLLISHKHYSEKLDRIVQIVIEETDGLTRFFIDVNEDTALSEVLLRTRQELIENSISVVLPKPRASSRSARS